MRDRADPHARVRALELAREHPLESAAFARRTPATDIEQMPIVIEQMP